MKKKVLLSWSSGKDSAWTLNVLRGDPDVEIVGLLTTFNESADRVAMHAVRRDLVKAQARAASLRLWPVFLPWPCSNEQYETLMRDVLSRARDEDVTHVAFGDLFLEEVRDYRIRQMKDTGIEPIFPIWGSKSVTPKLARDMIAGGLKAVLTCVDPRQLAGEFVGREFDRQLLKDLPEHVDPCGENGEFHTFCYEGPMFETRVAIAKGERVDRDGFCFIDIVESLEPSPLR